MRTTIEEINENEIFYNRERDASGNMTEEAYGKAVPRKVQLVTGWTRFGHYIIDALIIGVLLIGAELVMIDTLNLGYYMGYDLNGVSYSLIPTIDNIVITVGYYFICEKTMQRTIGKFATNSVVINEYAEPPETDRF